MRAAPQLAALIGEGVARQGEGRRRRQGGQEGMQDKARGRACRGRGRPGIWGAGWGGATDVPNVQHVCHGCGGEARMHFGMTEERRGEVQGAARAWHRPAAAMYHIPVPYTHMHAHAWMRRWRWRVLGLDRAKVATCGLVEQRGAFKHLERKRERWAKVDHVADSAGMCSGARMHTPPCDGLHTALRA